MPIAIHGKAYWPVAERLSLAHGDQDDRLQSIITEPVRVFDDGGVTFRAVVTFQSGRTFTGHAYESPASKGIAGQSPWEVAETSAVGRALGLAGYGSDESVASAEEVRRAPPPAAAPSPPPPFDRPQARNDYARLYRKAVELGHTPMGKDGKPMPAELLDAWPDPLCQLAVERVRKIVGQAEPQAA